MRSEYGFHGVMPKLAPFPRLELATPPTQLRCQTRIEPSPPDLSEVLLQRSNYMIRLADSNGQRSKVRALVNRMYSWRGYRVLPAEDVQDRFNQITLEASTGDQLFSTLTVTLDSRAGLAVDDLYRDKADGLRGNGNRLFEVTRLAADPRYSSKEALASLFHLAYIYARLIHRATDALIEVNPRHVGFYRRMLGFEQLGPERVCERVQAPAVLLHLDVRFMGKQIARYGGSNRQSGECSLYPYFFSEHEQEGLLRRISAHLDSRAGGGGFAARSDYARVAI